MPAIVLGILLITKTVLLFLSLSYKCETEARQTQMKEVIQNMNPVCSFLSAASNKESSVMTDRKYFSSLNNDILKDRTADPWTVWELGVLTPLHGQKYAYNFDCPQT